MMIHPFIDLPTAIWYAVGSFRLGGFMAKFHRKNGASAKLTASMVLDMRAEYAEGATQGDLSRKYEISVVQVGRIVRGESWQNLPIDLSPAAKQQQLLRSLEAAEEAKALGKMEGAIAAEKERDPDRMLEELKGPPILDEVKKRAKEFLG